MRFEIDIADPRREIPVYTTAEVHLDVGAPKAATAIPLYAAAVRGYRLPRPTDGPGSAEKAGAQ